MGPVDIISTFNSPWGRAYTFGDLVTLIVNTSMVVAGIIILFFFISGGLSMIIGAGNNDPQAVAKGKSAVTSAVVGFIIMFVSFWIIQIIEIISGSDFITYPLKG